MSDNKLKIRIHIQQPNMSGDNDQGDQDVLEERLLHQHRSVLEKPPFDWHKIAIAITVFAVLAGVAGYLFVGNDKTSGTDNAGVSHSGTGDAADHPARLNTLDNDRSALSLPEEQPESLPDPQETMKPLVSHASAGSGRQQSAEAAEIIPVPRMKPLRLSGGKMLIPPKPVIKPSVAETDSKSASAPLQSERDVVDIPAPTEAVESVANQDHSGVIRAQLTHQIRQREPVGEAYRVLLGSNNASSSIYFFIELSGFGGQQLVVDWYFEDRLVTETKLHIGARKWRTHAKKMLHKRDAGDWRVMLRDQSGRLLVERRFVVEV